MRPETIYAFVGLTMLLGLFVATFLSRTRVPGIRALFVIGAIIATHAAELGLADYKSIALVRVIFYSGVLIAAKSILDMVETRRDRIAILIVSLLVILIGEFIYVPRIASLPYIKERWPWM